MMDWKQTINKWHSQPKQGGFIHETNVVQCRHVV